MNKKALYALLGAAFAAGVTISYGTSLFDEGYKASIFMGAISGSIGLILLFDVMIWLVRKPWLRGPGSVAYMIAESNKIAREREASELLKATDDHLIPPKRLMIKCPNCGGDMPKFAMFCPGCGKDRKAGTSA